MHPYFNGFIFQLFEYECKGKILSFGLLFDVFK
jgi:hypothetical protein